MKQTPLLYKAEMVRSILCDAKTQTRRIVKDAALDWLETGFNPDFVAQKDNGLSPYGYAGDRLWVKETHWRDDEDGSILYAADKDSFELIQQNKRETGLKKYNWKPSIFMRREYSRINLEITGLRIERLQDISESDAIAEGVELDAMPANKSKTSAECLWRDYTCAAVSMPSAKESYRTLWESINGAGSWDLNPWVWVIEFKKEDK